MGGFLLVVRPEPGLSATMAAAKEMGLNAFGYPLFEIVPREWKCPDPADIDALLIGSANAIRHGGSALEGLLDKPVYAVGETTAEVARQAGFTVAETESGGLQKVLDQITPPIRLLRIAGADHVPLDPPAGVNIHKTIAYETKALELPEPLRPLPSLGLTVMLHSAAAAEQFTRESKRLALDRSAIKLVVIGPRVEEAAGDGWAAIHVSPQPNDAAMLEMAKNVCI